MSRRHPKKNTSGGRFARLPLTLLETSAVRTLSHAAFRVLVLLASEYRGSNNGGIGVTGPQATENGIGSEHTFYGALRDLEARGLIERTYPASRVPPRPTMYALTWLPVDATDYSETTRTASHAYRRWNDAAPPKPRRKRRTHLTLIDGGGP